MRLAPALTPTEALVCFVRAGKREVLVRELARKWAALGRSEVEDAVDAAIADATSGMHATHEQAIYEYLRTAAQRKLGRRKERAGRISAPIATDHDFDRVVADELSPEDVVLVKEHRHLVLDLFAALDDRTLAVMRLKHIEGLERKEVAEALGISEKAVKKAIERGHRICRDGFAAAMDGNLCGERRKALLAVASGPANARERRQAQHHLAHCASCRAEQRALAVAQRGVAALVPAPVLGTSLGRDPASGVIGRVADWFSNLPFGGSATEAAAGGLTSAAAMKAVGLVLATTIAGAGVLEARDVAESAPPRQVQHRTPVGASPSFPTAHPVRTSSASASGTRSTSRKPLRRKSTARRTATAPAPPATTTSQPAPAGTTQPLKPSTAPRRTTERDEEFPVF